MSDWDFFCQQFRVWWKVTLYGILPISLIVLIVYMVFRIFNKEE